jgi:hypothetical protein
MSKSNETNRLSNHFVADGQARAHKANKPRIRAAVEAEYAERWHGATPWDRFWLRREMNREIARRLQEAAPSYALY